MQVERKYYNPCRLALSGREYKVLRSYKDGRKKIQFDDFFGETVIASILCVFCCNTHLLQ